MFRIGDQVQIRSSELSRKHGIYFDLMSDQIGKVGIVSKVRRLTYVRAEGLAGMVGYWWDPGDLELVAIKTEVPGIGVVELTPRK